MVLPIIRAVYNFMEQRFSFVYLTHEKFKSKESGVSCIRAIGAIILKDGKAKGEQVFVYGENEVSDFLRVLADAKREADASGLLPVLDVAFDIEEGGLRRSVKYLGSMASNSFGKIVLK